MLTAIATATSLPSNASAELKEQFCEGLPRVRVVWDQQPAAYGGSQYFLNQVSAANGSTARTGWQLHHRPTAGWPYNPLAPETIINAPGANASVWDAAIPVLRPYYAPAYTVTSLTCPDGECVVSPITGCQATYDRTKAGPKVAVMGDSLLASTELCVFAEPGKRNCSPSITTLLSDQQYRVWLRDGMASGQGFYSYLDMTRERATTRPDIVVLAFATNDAILRQVPATGMRRTEERKLTRDSIRASVEAIRASNPSACVVFVTASGQPRDKPDYPAEVEYVNNEIRNAASAYGNIQVADFATDVNNRCFYHWWNGQNCPLFSDDQVHLSDAGDAVRNPLVLDAVKRCAAR